MRNINDRNALFAKALNDLEQQLDFGAGKTRSRLVENYHLVSAMEQRREGYELHLRRRQRRRRPIHIDVDADLLQYCLGLFANPALIEDAATGLVTEHDV